MSYYPASQIKPNQYTNGEEFILSSTQEVYVGDYYLVSNGERYTGKNYNDGSNTLLLPIETPTSLPSNKVIPPKEIIVQKDSSNPSSRLYSKINKKSKNEL